MAGSLELSVRHVDATVQDAAGLVVALSTTFQGGMEFLNFVCVGSELRRPGCALRLSTHARNAPETPPIHFKASRKGIFCRYQPQPQFCLDKFISLFLIFPRTHILSQSWPQRPHTLLPCIALVSLPDPPSYPRSLDVGGAKTVKTFSNTYLSTRLLDEIPSSLLYQYRDRYCWILA